MEPWDGPSFMVFTDGDVLGAMLDRNGLRPGRYYLTDDTVVMASEIGVLDVEEPEITHKGIVRPGEIFLIDFNRGQVIPDTQVKSELASRHPYGKWLEDHKMTLPSTQNPAPVKTTKKPVLLKLNKIDPNLLVKLKCYGYTVDTMQDVLGPMVCYNPNNPPYNPHSLTILSLYTHIRTALIIFLYIFGCSVADNRSCKPLKP